MMSREMEIPRTMAKEFERRDNFKCSDNIPDGYVYADSDEGKRIIEERLYSDFKEHRKAMDEVFKDSIKAFEKIFGCDIRDVAKPESELKDYVVTQMDTTTGQDKLVKIRATSEEEATKIFIANQTIFAVPLDEWNDIQDVLINDSDGDFKDFLINSKKELNESRTYTVK